MTNRPLQWPTVARTFVTVVVLMCLFAMSGCTDSDTRIDQIKQEAIASMQLKVNEVEAEKARIASEVRRSERDASTALAGLAANSDVEAARIKAEAEDKAAGAAIALQSFTAKRAADVESIRRTADASIAKIEAQQVGIAQLGQLAQNPAVAGLIGSLPGGAIVTTLLTGALGYGLRARSAKQADATWDEATKHMLTLMTPPPGVKS